MKTYPMDIKRQAKKLRGKGWSLGEIGLKFKIPKNTVSGWVRDIELTRKQKKRIKEKIITCGAIGRPLAAKLLHEKQEKWKADIRQKVKYLEKLSLQNQDIGKLICGLLYLCEGAKYPSSRFLHFGNSDPKIVCFFLSLLRKYYNIDENKLRFSIAYRYDQNYDDLRKYWSKLTGIPESRCFRSKPDMRTKGKPTLKKNYMGICRIIYYSTSLQFELQSIGEAIIRSGAEGS